ncbi:MAG: hypothetical protein A2921_03975 [Candidatus Magasanikbacteria bacterium RIFCSPLOWO2_01_FULL_43_20b]|uniref:Uncharacterized protein n=1 Tax=Candidatus Magasanikbacteria bacterium RIFCSPLOWO2_12_FULL_43_12 TaxID=1798692 RepID=A0A1F6MS39_9BACT|nr:MAG: hypothetical protein A3C74_03420 [Candidatus Magasanikbacteria bacterium RIFCSPHIGHO2_02_FULL_44_13]OGH73628.1 MAG: hypothetical protein A2921_03975 [Candidatus Magasanikbacteria bacterium RIFCSPLOWO2_01_FULL_43_20b]OGH74489.1 MAG: hypothetical protein A3G00_01725 [Candidatus Magasanikbacteria bacterium RIFCSPLOWO2_12_FULL_43_12]
MDNPEFGHSPEKLKEEAYKILLRETGDDGMVFGLIKARGIFRDEQIREIADYVRDEVTDNIARDIVDFDSFCYGVKFRRAIYQNKINDFCRNRGLSPFLDATKIQKFKAVNRLSGELSGFKARLEAVDELSKIIEKIRDEKHRQRLEALFKGATMGWTSEEIVDELERIEGKRVEVSRISQIYSYLRERYLAKRFPQMPGSLDDFRSLIEPKRYQVEQDRKDKTEEYLSVLSEDLEKLSGEPSNAQTKEEAVIMGYLLGREPRESLVAAGLSEQRKLRVVKERISLRLGIPFDFLNKQRIGGLSKI